MEKKENYIRANLFLNKFQNLKQKILNYKENQYNYNTYERENNSNVLFELFEINGDDDEYIQALEEDNPIKDYLLSLIEDKNGTQNKFVSK